MLEPTPRHADSVGPGYEAHQLPFKFPDDADSAGPGTIISEPLQICKFHSSFSLFLPGWKHILSSYFTFPAPDLESSHFSKKPYFLLVGKGIYKAQWAQGVLNGSGVDISKAF